MRPRSAALGLGLTLLAAIGVSACSSSSSPSASDTPTASAPAAATSPASPSTNPLPPLVGSGSKTASGKFNSCSVVTQAQAAAALGGPVSKGVLGKATIEGGLACVFYGQLAAKPRVPDIAQLDTVRVVVVEGSDALKWYNNYASKVQGQAVPGLGDEAYYDGNSSLSVMSGSAYLRVSIVPAGAPPALAPAEQLAKAILPTLSQRPSAAASS